MASEINRPRRGMVGTADRTQRLTIGLALLVLNLISIVGDGGTDIMRWIAMGIQVELILTGLFGWCPLYWSLSGTRWIEPNVKTEGTGHHAD